MTNSNFLPKKLPKTVSSLIVLIIIFTVPQSHNTQLHLAPGRLSRIHRCSGSHIYLKPDKVYLKSQGNVTTAQKNKNAVWCHDNVSLHVFLELPDPG